MMELLYRCPACGRFCNDPEERTSYCWGNEHPKPVECPVWLYPQVSRLVIALETLATA